MRKIVITHAVRTYADEYRMLVEKSCTNVVADLMMLRDNALKYNTLNNREAVEGYLNQLIDDYPRVLTLEPKDWNIADYKVFTDQDPKMLTQEIIYDYTKGNKTKGLTTKAKTGKLYERIMFCLRYSNIRTILGPIHSKMKLKACVYCNTQPTVSSPKGDVFYEMDHLKAQSEYPFLGTCFYNLQPCDGACNKRKLTKPCDFQLFVNDSNIELSPFKFVPQVIDLGNLKDFNCVDIKFVDQNGKFSAQTKEYNETFHIMDLYSAYRNIPSDIYWRNQQCARIGQVQSYKNGLDYEPTRDEVSSFCMGCTYNDNLIHEETLRKLKVDTMNQLEENGLLNI